MRRICSHSYSLDIFSLSHLTSLSLSTSQIISYHPIPSIFSRILYLCFVTPLHFKKQFSIRFLPFLLFISFIFLYYLLTRLFLPISFFSFRHPSIFLFLILFSHFLVPSRLHPISSYYILFFHILFVFYFLPFLQSSLFPSTFTHISSPFFPKSNLSSHSFSFHLYISLLSHYHFLLFFLCQSDHHHLLSFYHSISYSSYLFYLRF